MAQAFLPVQGIVHRQECLCHPSATACGSATPPKKTRMEWNRVVTGDCLALCRPCCPAGSVDLVFADPPFNIGYEYDVYDDRQAKDDYLDWTEQWIAAVDRVLKPDGTFWLAIGDEYAAELKVGLDAARLRLRNWVVWYYTFGVNCTKKFSRSHAHLFHFVKDPKRFHVQPGPAVRVPSARQTDLRRQAGQPRRQAAGRHLDAAAAGYRRRLPPDGDTWYFCPRLRHVQGAAGPPLPDARAAAGADHPRLRRTPATRARPVRRQRHDAGRGEEARPAVPRLRAFGGVRRGHPGTTG